MGSGEVHMNISAAKFNNFNTKWNKEYKQLLMSSF